MRAVREALLAALMTLQVVFDNDKVHSIKSVKKLISISRRDKAPAKADVTAIHF